MIQCALTLTAGLPSFNMRCFFILSRLQVFLSTPQPLNFSHKVWTMSLLCKPFSILNAPNTPFCTTARSLDVMFLQFQMWIGFVFQNTFQPAHLRLSAWLSLYLWARHCFLHFSLLMWTNDHMGEGSKCKVGGPFYKSFTIPFFFIKVHSY